MNTQTYIDKLQEALDLFDSPEKWIQGAMCELESKDKCYSHIHHKTPSRSFEEIIDAVNITIDYLKK